MAQRLFRINLLAYVCLSVFLVLAIPSGSVCAAERPRIALVLSGGGAKGAAHIGVLQVLEEMRIPVDIVLGTSMGSYVAGMYAMGYSADEVRDKTLHLDWNKGYQDGVTRQELALRQKNQADDFQFQTNIGVSDGKVKLPEGVYQGHGMAALLRDATSNLPTMRSFNELPIPYRAVATDIETVQPVILSQGNLALAMQASMSIPGALKPIEIDGKLLADGGIVNNLPVDIAKRMGAQVVIAVDISDKLKSRNELDSALGIIDQLTTYMTRSGTEKQLALMTSRDILLTPDVAGFAVADFEHMPQIVERGRSAAYLAMDKLRRLSLSPAEYEAYQQAKLDRRSQLNVQPAYYLDRIVIHNNSRLSDEVLRQMLQVETGKVQTTQNLEAGIERINALGTFERVTYEIADEQGQNVLVVNVTEKRWGPNYLDFTLGFEDDFHSRSNYMYGAAYTLTNLSDYGAEWRNEAILGSWKKISSEFYAPLDAGQKFYGQFGAAYRNETRAVFFDHGQDPWGKEITSGEGYVNLENSTWVLTSEMGWNVRPWSRVGLGLEGSTSSLSLQGYANRERVNSWGPYLFYLHDTLDSRFFPATGSYGSLRLASIHAKGEEAISPDGEWGLTSDMELRQPWQLTSRQVVDWRLTAGGSSVDELVPIYLQDLGGLFNLSGYQRYQLNGRYKLFGALIYRYRILENNFGALKAPVYTGWSLERGNVWNSKSEINWDDMHTAGSLYIGSDSFIGPVYLAYGRSDSGESAFYFLFGNAFGQ